jgi:predicted PhzF superfamily epimerase YddE/YHI9
MRQWMVDAFASAPFRGNPACVVEPFQGWPEDGWMQRLAQENNQAETAFLLRTSDPARFGLRWFTPALEVPLCGHATLAAAHVLAAELGLEAPELVFETRSGELAVRRAGDGYEMDFPADPPARIDPPAWIKGAIGAPVVDCWAGRYLTALVADEATVRGLRPDLPAIAANAGGVDYAGCLLVAAEADAGRPYRVVSRMFGPGAGIPEDPTTGSAHCLLSPLFSARLGRPVLDFHQAYPGRGGDLQCEHRGERVLLRGRAVTVLEGVLRL